MSDHFEVILNRLDAISDDVKAIKEEASEEIKEDIRFREKTVAALEALKKEDEAHLRHYREHKEHWLYQRQF